MQLFHWCHSAPRYRQYNPTIRLLAQVFFIPSTEELGILQYRSQIENTFGVAIQKSFTRFSGRILVKVTYTLLEETSKAMPLNGHSPWNFLKNPQISLGLKWTVPRRSGWNSYCCCACQIVRTKMNTRRCPPGRPLFGLMEMAVTWFHINVVLLYSYHVAAH